MLLRNIKINAGGGDRQESKAIVYGDQKWRKGTDECFAHYK